MKLVLCVAHNRDRNRLADELVQAGYKFTLFDSIGGFLREGNVTFMVGVDDEQLDSIVAMVQSNCCVREQIVNWMPLDASAAGALMTSPVKVPVGGAVIFVVNVEQFFHC